MAAYLKHLTLFILTFSHLFVMISCNKKNADYTFLDYTPSKQTRQSGNDRDKYSTTQKRNNNGFDNNGIHRNGTAFNEDGFDCYGFKEDGYNREGYNRYGFNNFNFNAQGQTKFGHTLFGIDYQVNHTIAGLTSQGVEGVEEIRYSILGFDQMGFQRPLVGQKFDQDGFTYDAADANRRVNFLGISKAQFDEYGYDAVTQYNLDGYGSQSLDQLITIYNEHCPQLYDNAVMFTDINTAEDLISRLNPDERPSDDALKTYLRKGIACCKWLTRPIRALSTTSINLNTIDYEQLQVAKGHGLKDRVNQINWRHKLAIEQVRKNIPLDTSAQGVYGRLIAAFTQATVINQAQFMDDHDELYYRHNKAEHIRIFFDACQRNQSCINIEEAHYKLRMLAENIHSIDTDTLIGQAGYILHGAAHCADAKRNAVDRLFAALCPNIEESLQDERNEILGDSVFLKLRSELAPVKQKYFNDWLLKLVRNNGGDANTSFASTWDASCEHFGIDKLGAAYGPGFVLPQFRGHEVQQTRASFFEDGDNNGKYTPFTILHALQKENTTLNTTLNQLFGPLLTLSNKEGDLINRNGDTIHKRAIPAAFLIQAGLLDYQH